MITLSRDPEDFSQIHGTVSVKGSDAHGPLTVIIDDDEVAALIDLANIGGESGDEIPEQVYRDLESLASKEAAKSSEHGRVIDLRPNFD